MNEHGSPETGNTQQPRDALGDRRRFLGDLGRWSGASLTAVIGGAAWLSTAGSARSASWVNRRYGGGWVNGGSAWVNGGGWINRSGGWINGGGSWVNGSRGGWVNRRGGGGWINRR